MEEFDIVDLIINTIEEELGIPCFFMICDVDLYEPYVIFRVDEREVDSFDNENLNEYYNIDITLWYTNPKDMMLYRIIKQKMKEKGFRYKKSYDLIDENTNDVNGVEKKYFGKLLEFSYKVFIN